MKVLITQCGVQPPNVGKVTLGQLEALFGGDQVQTFATRQELMAFYASLK